MEKIKVMVVDDHEFFRRGLIMTINKFKNFSVISEAVNGLDFLNNPMLKDTGLILMDIKMPEMDGIEATREAIKRYPHLNIIALSMFGEEEYLQHMLEAGAKGFLLKNITKEFLEKALNAVAEGKNYFSEELLVYFTHRYIHPEKTANNDTQLSKRELEVLQLVAEGFTNAEIAERLFISQRTVDGHKTNMISKTGSKTIVGLLVYAIKNNMVKI